MTIGYELIKELSVLSQGRAPEYSAQSEVTPGNLNGPPDSAGAGVALGEAVVTMIKVISRADASKRQADISVAAVDDTATYTATIGGTAHDYAAGAGDDALAILTGLWEAINAGAEPVTATLVDADEDGTDDTLHVDGDDAADYTIAVSATNAGELALVADATEFSFVLRLLSDGDWAVPPGGVVEAQTRNFIERAITAGAERAHIEITATDGRVTAKLGPCGLEGEAN